MYINDSLHHGAEAPLMQAVSQSVFFFPYKRNVCSQSDVSLLLSQLQERGATARSGVANLATLLLDLSSFPDCSDPVVISGFPKPLSSTVLTSCRQRLKKTLLERLEPCLILSGL